ncbi:PQQ-binding-like beta-propeller repeat protein [Maribellus sp. CM-23]|uniref:outer membrane protein assembly factor BamB family protein n=1 Tax=Maribellus sp. CM-23 TaxID=2781026 RepID=UPI001F3A6A2A|nr:PQQ-binding-like beta-propeller repeat protein [Maribellus sp. CM-23]MCE4566606.1 PQQ-binding-like beta-propeller repeat protein [Maribellus sp. CM-23]
MKKNIIQIAFVFMAIFALVNCKDELLPEANYLLDIAKNVQAVAGHEQVTLTWEKPSNDNLEQIVLKWSPDGGEEKIQKNLTSYVVKGLKNGTKYTFNIQGDYGETGMSGISKAITEPVDELKFEALAGNGFSVLIWEKPKREDLDGYKLSWQPDNGSLTFGLDKTSYTLQGLTNGEEYTFEMLCQYSDGTTSELVSKMATPGDVDAFNISTDQIFAGNDITFTFNPAYLPVSTATSWSWDFGDGITSTEQNPTHNYSSGGKYTVKLSFSDDNGENYEVSVDAKVIGVIWKYTPNDHIKTSSPAIASDGTIYAGDTKGYLHALNPEGTKKWEFLCGSDGDDIYGSCPAIGDDGTIYVGSYSGNLYALNPDGTEKWAFATGNRVFGSPAIGSDGTIYIGSQDDNVYAINPDGTQKWSFTTGSDVKSSPAIAADGTIYIGSHDMNLYALNPDGTKKWEFLTGGAVECSPVIGSDGTIYVGDDANENSKFYAVNPDGTQQWSYDLGLECIGNAVLAEDGTIYAGAKDAIFYAFSPNGNLKWQFTDGGRYIYASAAIAVDGTILLGSEDFNFYSLNPTDGSVNWKLTLDGQMFSSPVIGTDGVAYIGTLSSPGFYSIYTGLEGIANSTWAMKRHGALQQGRVN